MVTGDIEVIVGLLKDATKAVQAGSIDPTRTFGPNADARWVLEEECALFLAACVTVRREEWKRWKESRGC